MSWSEAEENFQRILEIESNTAFMGLNLSRVARERKNNNVVKGRNFLASLGQLKSLLESSYSPLLERFLDAATQTLSNPSEDNYSLLYGYLNRLTLDLNDTSTSGKFMAGCNIFVHSIGLTAGVGGVIMGTMYLECIIAGTCALAMGPGAAIALGIGFAILGGVVAAISAYKLYQNVRFCRGSQLKEITDLVNHLDPNPQAQRNVAPILPQDIPDTFKLT